MQENKVPQGFEALAEGGYCRRIYTGALHQGRPGATAIEYLLPAGGFSALHRLDADELWFHQGGGTIVLWRIVEGQVVKDALSMGAWMLIPGHTVFGAQGDSQEDARVICVVSPGYEPQGFSLCTLKQLQETAPTDWRQVAFLLAEGT